MKKDKRLYFEVLRLFAFLLVVFNHTGEYGFDLFLTTDSVPVRCLVIMIDNISKCGVPVFLMISGALLIPKKEKDIRAVLKRIVRILVVLTAVSFIYYIRLYIMHPEYGFSIKYFIQIIYRQPFITPFWFLYVYTAFLLMLPLMRKMAAGMNETEFIYFIILGLLFTCIPCLLNIPMQGTMYLTVPILGNAFFYPVVGYYIDSVFDPAGLFSEHKILRRVNYPGLAGVLMFVNALFCLVLTLAVHGKSGEWTYDFIGSFIIIPSFVIFYIAKSVIKDSPSPGKITGFVKYAGGCVFCVYLFEEMIREDIAMNIYRIWGEACPALLLFIPYAVTVFALGIGLASLLKLIPGVKEFL